MSSAIARQRRMVSRRLLARVAAEHLEDRALPGEPVGEVALAPAERVLERGQHRRARGAGRVERAALDERLERALVRDGRVDALGEVPDRLERPALVARGDDRAGRPLAHVLDRVEAEADLALDDREVGPRAVDVGRLDLDPHLVAGVDVERHAVLRVHHGRDQRGHVLVRVVGAQPGGAVGDQRVAGGVGLVEGVVLRLLHVVPELLGDVQREPVGGAALEELLLEGGHQRVDLLGDRLAEVVGLGGREAGELLGDLHVLLLVDADPVGRAS